ncbi:MAG: phosphoglucosamine mutase [Alphaproteobacteria bacterium]|nr:phosphoglucosamine mutase [Alphaproteobacteria bacterium]
MRKLFGTDGVRGLANAEPMTPETMLRLALAAGRHFTRGTHRHRVVIGKDTRLSGYMIEPALTAGFVAVGMDVLLLGPVPTPGVAMLTRSLRADLGVMISASHNPYGDNGVKLFGPDGFKLSDEIEAAIESHMDEAPALAPTAELGRARRLDDSEGRYIEFVKATFPKGLRLEGLKIVVDCANGAAYKVAPAVLWELGADVIPIARAPDGFNINAKCGATHPETLQSAVVAHNAHLGIALDGDADRLIMVDEHGHVIDGDQLMAMITRGFAREGRLQGGGLVATIMSNLGLERYIEGLGLKLARTKVGDRYVIERMRGDGINVGGEQSGHIILSDFATTGDGLLAALQILAETLQTQRPMSEAAHLFDTYPQLLKNVRFKKGAADPLRAAPVAQAIAAGEKALGREGRVVIRPSGTEPVIRVMAEGQDKSLVTRVVDDICGAIEQATRSA